MKPCLSQRLVQASFSTTQKGLFFFVTIKSFTYSSAELVGSRSEHRIATQIKAGQHHCIPWRRWVSLNYGRYGRNTALTWKRRPAADGRFNTVAALQ